MSAIKKYAAMWGRDPHDNLAVACYDGNSIEELLESTETVDEADCQAWGIGPTEWREAIAAALADRLADEE